MATNSERTAGRRDWLEQARPEEHQLPEVILAHPHPLFRFRLLQLWKGVLRFRREARRVENLDLGLQHTEGGKPEVPEKHSDYKRISKCQPACRDRF